MSNPDAPAAAAASDSNPPSDPSPPPNPSPIPIPGEIADRTELLETARQFLSSEPIRGQDLNSKRDFLLGKGLQPAEIEYLLREIPPLVPPRTYPRPIPSRLPLLLASLVRIFAWFTGLSTAAILFYYTFILPRLILTRNARHHLRFHHLSLIKRLREGMINLHFDRLNSRNVLGIPEPEHEVEVEVTHDEESHSVPPPPESTPNPPLLTSLSSLQDTISSSKRDQTSSTQSRTLQSLTDLTAYISSQLYSNGSIGLIRYGLGSSVTSLGPLEEEMRRDIRAMKGLVLNRRTFTAPSPVPRYS